MERFIFVARVQSQKHKTDYNICTTSAQRLRRWSNIVKMLYKCCVFTGMWLRGLF